MRKSCGSRKMLPRIRMRIHLQKIQNNRLRYSREQALHSLSPAGLGHPTLTLPGFPLLTARESDRELDQTRAARRRSQVRTSNARFTEERARFLAKFYLLQICCRSAADAQQKRSKSAADLLQICSRSVRHPQIACQSILSGLP